MLSHKNNAYDHVMRFLTIWNYEVNIVHITTSFKHAYVGLYFIHLKSLFHSDIKFRQI